SLRLETAVALVRLGDPAGTAALQRLAYSAKAKVRCQVAELAGERPLGRLAMARLVRLIVAEPDELVWQRVLTAVAGDASEPSIRLAYAAVSHPSAEVRRRACDNLAAHPHPGHAKMLVPALEDRDHAVVCAAVRALGAADRCGSRPPLRLSGSAIRRAPRRFSD
ncbi:MAG: HEAT repeat domain-containing protein, partial [Planctomycetota bacterium]